MNITKYLSVIACFLLMFSTACKDDSDDDDKQSENTQSINAYIQSLPLLEQGNDFALQTIDTTAYNDGSYVGKTISYKYADYCSTIYNFKPCTYVCNYRAGTVIKAGGVPNGIYERFGNQSAETCVKVNSLDQISPFSSFSFFDTLRTDGFSNNLKNSIINHNITSFRADNSYDIKQVSSTEGLRHALGACAYPNDEAFPFANNFNLDVLWDSETQKIKSHFIVRLAQSYFVVKATMINNFADRFNCDDVNSLMLKREMQGKEYVPLYTDSTVYGKLSYLCVESKTMEKDSVNKSLYRVLTKFIQNQNYKSSWEYNNLKENATVKCYMEKNNKYVSVSGIDAIFDLLESNKTFTSENVEDLNVISFKLKNLINNNEFKVLNKGEFTETTYLPSVSDLILTPKYFIRRSGGDPEKIYGSVSFSTSYSKSDETSGTTLFNISKSKAITVMYGDTISLKEHNLTRMALKLKNDEAYGEPSLTITLNLFDAVSKKPYVFHYNLKTSRTELLSFWKRVKDNNNNIIPINLNNESGEGFEFYFNLDF